MDLQQIFRALVQMERIVSTKADGLIAFGKHVIWFPFINKFIVNYKAIKANKLINYYSNILGYKNLAK